LERFFGGPISVRRLAGPVLMPDPGQRARLGLLAATAWRHRRVELVRDGAVLSEADLWFVPARLTPDMVVALEGTDIPFGRVVRPLGPKRTRIAGMGEALPPGVALVHRAILATATGPIAEVHERYPVTLADMPATIV
jgi:hypothetical protein